MTNYQFYPRFRYISDITNDQQAVVTCTEDHDFTVGEIVSFRVSRQNGMYQINNRQSKVISITSDTVTVDLDTLSFDDFIPGLEVKTLPVIVPSSSGVISDLYTTTVTLEDAFDNRRV